MLFEAAKKNQLEASIGNIGILTESSKFRYVLLAYFPWMNQPFKVFCDLLQGVPKKLPSFNLE